MKVKLVREARIRHKPGEIVEVSPGEAQYLLSVGSAVAVPVMPSAEKQTPKKRKGNE